MARRLQEMAFLNKGLTIKLTDERFRSLMTSGQIQLIYYSPRGQECIPATISQLTGTRDYMVTTYRGIHDQVAKGVDLDPKRIREARANAKKAGVEHLVTFEVGDMFKTDISEATVVTLYMLPEFMEKLEPQVKKLRPGTRLDDYGTLSTKAKNIKCLRLSNSRPK